MAHRKNVAKSMRVLSLEIQVMVTISKYLGDFISEC